MLCLLHVDLCCTELILYNIIAKFTKATLIMYSKFFTFQKGPIHIKPYNSKKCILIKKKVDEMLTLANSWTVLRTHFLTLNKSKNYYHKFKPICIKLNSKSMSKQANSENWGPPLWGSYLGQRSWWRSQIWYWWKGLVTGIAHKKYDSTTYYGSEVMMKVKVLKM